MTDEEINEEICKHNGWKFSDHPDHIAKTALWHTAKSFVIKPDGEFVFRRSIPNYCKDLNAMHDVEKTIYRGMILKKYYSCGYGRFTEVLRVISNETVSATARQRAEAFLRTIGKWKEEV